MPRAITAGLRALLASEHFVPHLKMEVQDSDGTYRDMSAVVDVDYVDGIRWAGNMDSPVYAGTAFFRRDVAGKSLAPLMGSSAANRNAANAYAALLKASRGIRGALAFTAPGGALSGSYGNGVGDWLRVVDGKIDTVRWAVEPIEVQFRDKGAWLLRKYIPVERSYGSLAGTAIETVLQGILTHNPTHIGTATLVTPVSPAWLLPGFKQPKMVVMEALRGKALSIGHDLRYMWTSANSDELRFWVPDAGKTTPDFAFGPDEYFDVEELQISDEDIRNVVEVTYVDANGAEQSVTRTNAASIAEYGEVYMRLGKDKTSSVRTAGQATNLADRALSDLSQPGAEHRIRTSIMPFVELADLLEHMPNDVHYDSAQKYAVVGYEHEIRAPAPSSGATIDTDASAQSTFTTRGKPAVAFKRWLRPGVDEGLLPGIPEIAFVNDWVPIFDADGEQIGWQGTGAVDDECNSLMIALSGGLEIYSVAPLGFQYFSPAGTEYRADTTTVKEFVIELRQAAGATGLITLTPRGEHSTTGGGGSAGPIYEQELFRTPFTNLEIEKTNDPSRRNAVFTVSPADSELRFRLTVLPGGTPSGWFTPTLTNGKWTEASISLADGDVLVEYFALSAQGVAEDQKRQIIDEDDIAEWDLAVLRESPANYVLVSLVDVDDDVDSWAIWARRGSSPKSVTTGVPADAFLKRPYGDIKLLSAKFYAEAGTWYVVVRVKDKSGNITEQTSTIVITGAEPAAAYLESIAAFLSGAGPYYNTLYWQHNQELEDAAGGAHTVRIVENGVEKVTGRDVRTGADGVSLPAREGGWRREVVPAADPSAESAEYLTWNYTIELRNAAATLVATYTTSFSGWYAGTGEPEEGTPLDPGDPDNQAPTPGVVAPATPPYTATATWTDDNPDLEVRIQWEEAAAPAYDFVLVAEAILDLGTTSHVQAGFATGRKVRARIAYQNAAGVGPWSDYSNEATISGSGGGSVAPTDTPPVPTLSNVVPFTARAAWTGASSEYKVRARFETSVEGVGGWALSGTVLVNAGVAVADLAAVPDGMFVRAQIAYENSGGTGPYSAFSNVVEIVT